MNLLVHLNSIVQIIAILNICTIECKFVNTNVEHKAFITHFGNNLKNFQIGSNVITNQPFDPGGTAVTDEYLEDLKRVFLFNVAHKLNEGRKLLDSFTVPLSKQKLAIDHFNSYFKGGYAPKAKYLEDVISDFESSKFEINETIGRIQDVFISEILNKYQFVKDILDSEALSRQVDLIYAADLMASYILLFTPKMIRRVLFRHIWTNFAFLDSDKEYLCCNWIVNGGVHDLDLHKKFNLDDLTNEDLINIIRLHKNYLSFVKVKSRKVLNTLDRSTLLSIFQTILMRSIWAHYVHEPSNLSIDRNKGVEEENEQEESSEQYLNLIKSNEDEEDDEFGGEGYLDNIYEWMIRYKNKLNRSTNVRGINYLDTEEFNQLKTTLNELEKMYLEMAPIKTQPSTRASRRRVNTDEDLKRKELRQSLKALIEYYKDHITNMGGVYGKIREEQNILFINNLLKYDRDHLLNLVVIYLSAIPELKQITNRQIYLNYMTLSKTTLAKLLYIAMMRTNHTFAPLINHFYSYDPNYLNSEELKKLEEKMASERKLIIEKHNFTLDTQSASEQDSNPETISYLGENGSDTTSDGIGKEDDGDSTTDDKITIEKEDVIIFETDELEGLIDVNAKVNKNVTEKWTRINKQVKHIITLGTTRTDEVVKSILKHPPHYYIVLKLLNENQYENEIIKINIQYLNEFYPKTDVKLESETESDEENETFSRTKDEQNVQQLIRNKKVEVILNLMAGDELKRLYNRFLQYVYPFNTMNTTDNYKEYLSDQELGDDDVQIEPENDIFGNLTGELNEERVNEMINKYAEAQENKKHSTLRENIISYLSRMVSNTEDEFEKSVELSEKNDQELIKEAKDHVSTLENDPNTLRIKVESCRPRGGRACVFTILPSEKENNYRNMKLNSISDEDGDVAYFDDYLDGADDVEYSNDEDGFKVNDVVIKRNKDILRSYSHHLFADRPGERIDSLEFGEDAVDAWMKLGLNMNTANAAVNYLTHLYNKPNIKVNMDGINSIGEKNELFVSDGINGLETVSTIDDHGDVDSISLEKGRLLQLPMRPSLIQMLSIPEILNKDKKNLIIAGSVGSGKTFAYLLPILQTLKEHEKRKLRETSSPRCLILTPTSELCDQIGKVLKSLSHMIKISSVTISKDSKSKHIKDKLSGLMDVVVAMPSKLMRYRDHLKLSQLKYLVIDEADCMLNEGFFPQVYSILQQIPNYTHITRSTNKDDQKQQVQIIQVASNISYLKFFETIQESFKKFLHRNSLIDSKKKSKHSESSEDEQKSNELDENEYTVNLKKLFGKNKKRIELYKHILDYYFSPLNKKKNDTFVYNNKIIEDLLSSHKLVDEIGITRPSKGIRHMFIPSNNEKVRALINVLKYDLKYDDSNKCLKNNQQDSAVEMNEHSKEDRKIIIFCRKVKAVIAVDYYLNEAGFKPISIHSEMPFKMRRTNFNEFKRSKSSILITTELMSRGLDLDVDVVILFDFPLNPNEYIRKSSILVHTPILSNPYIHQSIYPTLLSQDGFVKYRQKLCIGLIDKKDKVLSEAIKRSLVVDYFPINKLSSRRKDYNHITGRLKYLTQAGCYFKFLSYLRGLRIEGIFTPSHMHKYLDKFREIVKEQFINSFKKVKLRRIRICKKRRELMRKLKMMKKWNKAIRLKQRIISDLDRKKREKDYIYVGLTKDQRSCPPMKNLKKIRYELLKLKLLKGSNSEKLLKRSQNQIYKFINRLQTKLVDRNHLMDNLTNMYGSDSLIDNLQIKSEQISIFEQVKDKLKLIKSEDKNKNVRRICSLI